MSCLRHNRAQVGYKSVSSCKAEAGLVRHKGGTPTSLFSKQLWAIWFLQEDPQKLKQTAKSSWKNRGDLQWKDTFSLTNAQNTLKPKNRRQQPTPIPVPTSHLRYDQWLHRRCTEKCSNELQPIRDLDKTASRVNKTASQRRKSKLWRINSVRKSKHQKKHPKGVEMK